MSWLAHLVGGPKDGEIEFANGYWPMLVFPVERYHTAYRLRCWVQRNGEVEPGTPLVYAWEGLTEAEAVAAIDSYLALHTEPSGSLAGFMLTRLPIAGRLPSQVGPDQGTPQSSESGQAPTAEPADVRTPH